MLVVCHHSKMVRNFLVGSITKYLADRSDLNLIAGTETEPGIEEKDEDCATRSDATIRRVSEDEAGDGANDRRDAADEMSTTMMRETHNRNRRVRPTAHCRSHRSNWVQHASDHTGSHRSMGTFVCFGWTIRAALEEEVDDLDVSAHGGVCAVLSRCRRGVRAFSTRYSGGSGRCARRQRAISHRPACCRSAPSLMRRSHTAAWPLPAARSMGGSPQWSASSSGAPLAGVLFDPAVVAVAAVAQDVGLVGDETPALRRSCEGARMCQRRARGESVARGVDAWVRGRVGTSEATDRRRRGCRGARTPREVSAGHRSRITRTTRSKGIVLGRASHGGGQAVWNVRACELPRRATRHVLRRLEETLFATARLLVVAKWWRAAR